MIIVKSYQKLLEVKYFLPFFLALYPKKSKSEILQGLKILTEDRKYQLLVAFESDVPMAIMGVRISYLLYCGKYLQISNLFVDKKYRNLGIAKNLLREAERIAKENNCSSLVLDSFVDNNLSHKTYLKENFEIRAFHFTKELSIEENREGD